MQINLPAAQANAAIEPYALKTSRETIRARIARLDCNFQLHSAEELRRVSFRLFDDAILTAVADTQHRQSVDQFSLSGSLKGEGDVHDGSFVLAIDDDQMFATFWSVSQGTFELRTVADGSHVVIRQVDAQQLGGCINGPEQVIDVQAGANDEHNNDAALKLCEQSVDVLVLFTPAARNALGSDTAAQAFAQACVASANLVLHNSQISPRMRLVGSTVIPYVESSNLAIDLARLQSPFDTFLDEAHVLRQQFGADLVSLIVSSNANGCGVGYVMTQPSKTFAPFGMSVIQQSCALANFTFAHELAHNYGCQHDHGDASAGAFAYSHGYQFTGGSGQQWRTVMAGSPGVRIPYLSSPFVQFDGVATGISEDTPKQGPPSENARSLFNTSHFVGRFADAIFIDCNNNGVDDACDTMIGGFADVNANGIPDECEQLECSTLDLKRLVPIHARSHDRFGSAVSMSDERIAVGAMLNDQLGNDSGAVYVFDAMNRTAPAMLHPNDPAIFDWFGAAVAISPDGQRLLIGAPRDGSIITDIGAAYVFHFNGVNWVQEAKLLNPDPQQAEFFGWSVAWLGKSDGSLHAIIGAVFDSEIASAAGAVYIFPQVDAGWGPHTKLVASDAQAGDRFGHAVAGSLNGDRIVVGAPHEDHAFTNAGAAYVFYRAGDTWVEEIKLVASDPSQETRFGSAVAIDGDLAIIGSPRDGQFGERAGAAYVFTNGTSWSQQIKLVAADAGPHKQFGTSVAIRNNRAIVGSILDTTFGSSAGAAFIFDRSIGDWRQQARLVPRNGEGYDNFGSAIAIAPTAPIAVIGASFDDEQGLIDVGSAMLIATDVLTADCNGNGVSDHCDIAQGTSTDANNNGVPDECDAPACPADLVSDDGHVGVPELLLVINHWGPCDATCPLVACTADLTDDCTINAADLLAIISQWGVCSQQRK